MFNHIIAESDVKSYFKLCGSNFLDVSAASVNYRSLERLNAVGILINQSLMDLNRSESSLLLQNSVKHEGRF